MKICPKCSAENSDANLFCLNCGEDLSAVTARNNGEGNDFSNANDSQNMYANGNQMNNNANMYNQPQYQQNGAQPQYQNGAQQQYQNGAQQQYQNGVQPQYQAGQWSQAGNAYGQNTYNNSNNINATPFIVWSALNLIFCCIPLGIASLIFSLQINSASSYEEAEKKKKTAMILCIVGTSLGFVIELIYFFVVILATL
jgi:uncharacterized membrane protein YvbJ